VEVEGASAAAGGEAGDEQPFVFEQHLLSVRECFVYQIPTLKSSRGYRWVAGLPP
jgi:hypothetical protein